jgi:hypothetical protein
MDESLRRACYFAALSRLQRGLLHDVRSHLGSVALQLELIGEILAREGESAGGLAGRLRPSLERGKTGLGRVRTEIERTLGALAPPAGSGLDLMDCLREIEALVSTTAREREVTWTVAPAAGPSIALASPVAAREILSITAIESLFALPAGGRLDIGSGIAEHFASVSFAGAAEPAPDLPWFQIVREAVGALGGAARSDSTGVELRLPLLES